MRLFAFCALFICGCAEQAPIRNSIVIYEIPRQCITDVRLTDATKCVGADPYHLDCSGISLTKIDGCAEIKVKAKAVK